jgi:hypothetical protein
VKHVLVLTHSGDRYVVERVAAALERQGAIAHRFDTDLFPRDVRLAASSGGDRRTILREEPADLAGSTPSGRGGSGQRDRRALKPVPAGPRGAPRRSRACSTRSTPRRGIDPPDRARGGQQAPAARLAEESASKVRADARHERSRRGPRFADANGEIVAMLTPLSVGMEHEFLRTSHVRGGPRAPDASARPDAFQALVLSRSSCASRRRSPRVRGSDRRIEPSEEGRLAARAAGRGALAGGRGSRTRVAAGMFDLMEELGLRFGAVDLIRRPDGGHVFLEINPTGEWGMLEKDLGLPISEALAEELLDPSEA